MPNNDKKYTLDDILAEYEDTSVNSLDSSDSSDDVFSESSTPVNDEAFSGTVSEEQSAESPQIEEYDNYEDCSEQDISADFSIEPMFAPADVFPDAEDEEIFSDEDESDSEDIENEETEELVEDITVTSETSEPEITEIDVPQFIGDEFQSDENLDNGVKDWSAAGIAEEIEIPTIAEEIPEAEENEDIPETSAADTVADTEDVNDKWVVRALKAIFPVKGDSVGEVIRKIIFIVAVVVFIGAGIMLVSTLIQSKQAGDIKETNKSVIVTTVATSINDKGEVVTVPPTEAEKAQHNFDVAEYYKGINEDYVGYLEVAGCDIHEPVVQSEDNDKYLRTTIYGGTNKAGTIFADYRCTISEDYMSPNIVLYGHNQEDLTMFGSLKEYKQNIEFYRENPVVNFNPAFESGEYLIYGFFVTHVREDQDRNGIVFHYQDYIEKLNDESTFNWYINEIQKRNQIITPVDVKFGDKLLCLSTCSNEFTDSRFVVFARKLREGESVSDYDFDKAYLNGNAQGVDWDAITSGDISDDDNGEPEEEIDESSGKTVNKRNLQTEITRLVGDETSETSAETTRRRKNTETSAADTEADTEETTAPETTSRKKRTTAAEETETEETTSRRKKKTTAETTVPETETTEDTGTETSVPGESETENSSETEVPDVTDTNSES